MSALNLHPDGSVEGVGTSLSFSSRDDSINFGFVPYPQRRSGELRARSSMQYAAFNPLFATSMQHRAVAPRTSLQRHSSGDRAPLSLQVAGHSAQRGWTLRWKRQSSSSVDGVPHGVSHGQSASLLGIADRSADNARSVEGHFDSVMLPTSPPALQALSAYLHPPAASDTSDLSAGRSTADATSSAGDYADMQRQASRVSSASALARMWPRPRQRHFAPASDQHHAAGTLPSGTQRLPQSNTLQRTQDALSAFMTALRGKHHSSRQRQRLWRLHAAEGATARALRAQHARLDVPQQHSQPGSRPRAERQPLQHFLHQLADKPKAQQEAHFDTLHAHSACISAHRSSSGRQHESVQLGPGPCAAPVPPIAGARAQSAQACDDATLLAIAATMNVLVALGTLQLSQESSGADHSTVATVQAHSDSERGAECAALPRIGRRSELLNGLRFNSSNVVHALHLYVQQHEAHARGSDKCSVAQSLADHGTALSAQCSLGCTALDRASSTARPSAAALLQELTCAAEDSVEWHARAQAAVHAQAAALQAVAGRLGRMTGAQRMRMRRAWQAHMRRGAQATHTLPADECAHSLLLRPQKFL